MSFGRPQTTLVATAIALVLAAPASAYAGSYLIERGIIGAEPTAATFSNPDISGSNIVYGRQPEGAPRAFCSFSLTRGLWAWMLGGAPGIDRQAVSGDWAVWQANGDIGASDLRVNSVLSITTDAAAKADGMPAVSTADGAYVVWQRESLGQYDIKGKALGTTGLIFTVASGVGDQTAPAIYGKRVAYLDDSGGVDTVYVKTIGGTSASMKLTSDGKQQWSPDIGDHLVAWEVLNASGRSSIRYYDFDTGQLYDGPSSATDNMWNPQVSGDRILYMHAHGSHYDLEIWDTRIAKTTQSMASFQLAPTTFGDMYGRIDGNQIAYLAGNIVYFAKLAAPSIALNAVPTRIAHGGHIHLTGSISDRGNRIGGAVLGIEKYASGKWTRVKTLTASSTGTFSYKTPKTYSKTKYRVVYDGHVSMLGAPVTDHLSTRSAVKTAWPR
jgi:hypothetical protein